VIVSVNLRGYGKANIVELDQYMEYEVELKLLTNQSAGGIIQTSLLPKLAGSAEQQTLVLTNHYFDTPDRILRQHDVGLRVRGNNQTFEQTLKTAGKSMGGLHQRPEFNAPIAHATNPNDVVCTPEPILADFPSFAWPNSIDVPAVQSQLNVLFTTHFTRHVYLLELSPTDTVEMVWDVGHITAAGSTIPICEIELELKHGQISSLFSLAKRLAQLMPTRIGIDSKAARGYALLNNKSTLETINNPYSELNPSTSTLDLVTLLEENLLDFQRQSIELSQLCSKNRLDNISQLLTLLSQNIKLIGLQSGKAKYVHIEENLLNLVNTWDKNMQSDSANNIESFLTSSRLTQAQLDIAQLIIALKD
jgi:triphosphatase